MSSNHRHTDAHCEDARVTKGVLSKDPVISLNLRVSKVAESFFQSCFLNSLQHLFSFSINKYLIVLFTTLTCLVLYKYFSCS